MNFQAESTASGSSFEKLVEKDLIDRGYTIISTNTKIDDIGINVDYVAQIRDTIEYGEAKGGWAGKGKRPGAQRTDNVKKAICNGALLKAKDPKSIYVIYFSAIPREGNASDQMLNTAVKAGYVDEIRYLCQ